MPQIAKKIQAQEQLPLFQGQTTSITLPSGRVVKIRETNGEDDDLISSYIASEDGSNVYNFLSAITLHDSLLNRKPLPDDIMQWPINDKYALLFKQRLFIHGPELKFSAICREEKCKKETKYTEDLSQWDTDLSKDIEPKNGIAIKPYPLRDKMEIELSIASGKKFKYSILNGISESKALELKDATINAPLIYRDLHVQNKGEWVKVTHFAGFGSKELNAVRTHIKEFDKQFDPMLNFTCGNPKCNKAYSVSLFAVGAFFFPEETI